MEEVFFKVETNEKVGRYALAKKDLKPGDVIFEETPFCFGPKSDHPPMCLACYLPVDCSYFCSKCQWPMCGLECEENPAHRQAECTVFADANIKFQPVKDLTQICLQFECITPLRMLLAKEKDESRWDCEVAAMQSHLDKRKSEPIWTFNQINVVEYLRGPCKLERFPERLIHEVCGILDVNAFEALPINGGFAIRCLYPRLAILSHNCVSNVTHSIGIGGEATSGFKVQVRACVNVKQGEELFSSYVYTFWPTLMRRLYLKESKYFDCDCDRCQDPTELGTHMGTLKCSKCDNGVILSQDTLNPEGAWKCTHCDFRTKATSVLKVYRTIQADIDNVDNEIYEARQGVEAREMLYRKYRSVLHPRNAYHTILRISLSQMYGQVEGYALDELPDLLLERKVELCQQLLENLNVIDPGYTRTRGIALYELHAPLILLARNLYRTGSINKSYLRNKLEEAIKLLEESSKILKLEPGHTLEGRLAIAAGQALEQLKGNIDELVNAEF